MRRFLLAAAAAVSLGVVASQAQAATVIYNLTDDHCTGTCGNVASFGTLSVTGSGDSTTLNFAVDLADNVFFNPNGAGLDTFSWDLLNNPLIAISGLTSGFTVTTPQSAGTGNANHEDGFGNFDYVLNVGTSSTLQHLAFNVTGSGANAGQILTIDHNTADNQSIFGSVDIIGTNGNTGVVGATLSTVTTITGGVPEPATWALMIVGFGGVGASLRARRRTVAATA